MSEVWIQARVIGQQQLDLYPPRLVRQVLDINPELRFPSLGVEILD